jgi:hypothetical protein
LPVNFFSPYRATSIIDFWRRWHITLSRFFRDYVYIPLGGSRRGVPQSFLILFATMLLVGLWHGAGWTFVIWGGLQGVYLIVNHGWRRLAPLRGGLEVPPFLGWMMTFTAVVFAWVFFRADSLGSAANIISGMVGANGLIIPDHYREILPLPDSLMAGLGVTYQAVGANGLDQFFGGAGIGKLVLVAGVVFLLPNTVTFLRKYPLAQNVAELKTWPGFLTWRLTPAWAFCIGIIAMVGLIWIPKTSEFIYFRF